MMLIGLLLIGLIIYTLIGQQNNHAYVSNAFPKLDALEMAKIRLASGEITIEEFEKIKYVIR